MAASCFIIESNVLPTVLIILASTDQSLVETEIINIVLNSKFILIRCSQNTWLDIMY